jgi:hypothetical protein
MEVENKTVELYCIKEKGKLRVRISTHGYFSDANVQFPRDIRKDGLRYEVISSDIKLITTKGKYFYSVRKKDNIKIITSDTSTSSDKSIKNITIHTDEDNTECCICMTNEKEIVFGPCGHYYSCSECSNKISKCPICRTNISNKIKRSEFG